MGQWKPIGARPRAGCGLREARRVLRLLPDPTSGRGPRRQSWCVPCGGKAMRGAHKQRGMAAPRVAEELPAIHHIGSPRSGGGLSDKKCWSCCCRVSRSSSRVRGRQRKCGCSWRVSSLFSRKATRQSFALVLLCLAGAFSLRGWRAAMMIDSAPFRGGGGRWTTSSNDLSQQQRLWLVDDQRNAQCEWELGGPILFNVQHSKLHADAKHWFHVAECFIGRRSHFKEYFAEMAGTEVYLQDSDTAWNSKLTPMTRLLMMAGLTSVGVRAVHFIDGNHASFSFPLSSRNKRDGGAEAGGVRGGRVAAKPEAGQVGVLRLDDVGRSSQFVVTTEQPMPDKLSVSAPVSPVSPAQPSGATGAGAGSGGGVEGGAGVGGAARQCVKYAGNVGSWGQKRAKWFPEEDDRRELLWALDNFCPISWLRKEQQEREELYLDDRDQDNGNPMLPPPAYNGGGGNGWMGRRAARGLFATAVGGPGAAGKKKKVDVQPKKLVIYQRDHNRKLLNAEEVADELWVRLGHIGWTFTEIIHDDTHHPCDLIEELAGADVLLTAHGFQSMLSIFMAPGSILFEVYPHKYYKTGYAPLAQSLGHGYGYSQSPPLLPFTSWARPSLETCMGWYWCRKYVRGSDVVLDEDSLEVLISLMLKSLRVR